MGFGQLHVPSWVNAVCVRSNQVEKVGQSIDAMSSKVEQIKQTQQSILASPLPDQGERPIDFEAHYGVDCTFYCRTAQQRRPWNRIEAKILFDKSACLPNPLAVANVQQSAAFLNTIS